MGKTNKAQRTKGNTRPSSSGHSAQLLNFSGKSFSGFIGFDALEKEVPSYIPVTGQHGAEAADNSVDSDFRMVMRKMLKRDCVTRLKAVQEFGDYCAEKDVTAVKNVIPFWPRLFNKLAMDYDRRIREATHCANGKLISKVKRDIAPYLKNIMGVWLLGQCDLYAPAASSAQSAFVGIFPPAKQSEALMYCKVEIFAYFKDNLFEQTAKSLSETVGATDEEAENKYTLVISCTLQAMKLFLTIIPPDELQNIRDDYFSIIAENKFWKYAKSKESLIRGAWYALIASLCQVKPDIFSEVEKKLTNAVLGCLSESDPVVAPSVWEAALHTIVNFENCWQGIDIYKVVLPQLFKFLKEGGMGNAHILFPCLLPFLSKFPKEILQKKSFQQEIFASLWQGFKFVRVQNSSMECDAILVTFFECLQYMSCNILDDAREGPDLLERVIIDQILPVVEDSFYNEKDCALSSSKFYRLLGSLIQSIEKRCCLENKEMTERFNNILNLLWDSIYSSASKIFTKEQKERNIASEHLMKFFNNVFGSSSVVIKSHKSKVRFNDENEPFDDALKQLSEPYKFPESHLLTVSHTSQFIIKFCKNLVEKINENVDINYLKLLSAILSYAVNKELLTKLLKEFPEMCQRPDQEVPMIFFKDIILKWVLEVQNDRTCVDTIVSIIFNICIYFSEKEFLEVLCSCSEMKIPVLLQKTLCKGIDLYSNQISDGRNIFFHQWIKSDLLMEAVVNSIKDMLNNYLLKERNESSLGIPEKEILDLCLHNRDLQETLISTNSIEKILCTCKDFIAQRLQQENIEYCIPIVCDITRTIMENCKACWENVAIDDMLLLLFQLNLKASKYKLSGSICEMLSNLWQSAVFSCIQVRNELVNKNNFILRSAAELHNCFFGLSNEKDGLILQNQILNLLQTVEKALAEYPNSSSVAYVLSALLEKILLSGEEWEQLKDNLTMSYILLFVERKLFYPFPEEESFIFPESDLKLLILISSVISNIFVEKITLSSPNEEEHFFEQYIIHHLPGILWSLSYCRSIGYSDQGLNNLCNLQRLQKNCVKMVSYLSSCKVDLVLTEIFNCSFSNEKLWTLSFHTLLDITEAIQPEVVAKFSENHYQADMSNNTHMALTVQVLIHHLSPEVKQFHLTSLLQKILDEQDSIDENGYICKISEICCYVQDSRLLKTTEIQNLLINIIPILLNLKFDGEKKVLHSLQMTALFSCMVQYMPHNMSPEIWNCCVSLLSFSLKENREMKFSKPKDLLTLYEISSLLSDLSSFIKLFSEEQFKLTSELGVDWKPTMDKEVYEDFVSLYIYVTESIGSFYHPPHQVFEVVLTQMLKGSEFIPKQLLFEYLMKDRNGSKCKLLKSHANTTGLHCVVDSMVTNIREIHFISYSMLTKIIPVLADVVAQENSENEYDDDEEKIPVKLSPLLELICFTNDIVENMLLDIRIGDCCVVVPYTDSYTFATVYLLAWLLMLEFISCSKSQVRPGYIVHLEETKLLSSLFSNAFRLMPDDPVTCLKTESYSDISKKEALMSLFRGLLKLRSDCLPCSEEIQRIACFVFATALKVVPASVRTWWNNLDKKSSDIVNRFTSKYISGILCAEEIQAVHDNEIRFRNMMVKARIGSREVIASYTVDDSTIELSVQLPANYPLGQIIAERRGNIIVAQQEWRQWLIQLTTVLNFQNGSILDGLTIWKKNLDKKFEGVEECMICYYILHNSSLKLPKLSCHVCRKKFHSACLYKWFNTSNNFTCPLCRNEFAI